jgi:flavin-dependent dehydrogenase
MSADSYLLLRFRLLHNRWHARTKDAPVAYCPRRTVLDKLLVDAAAKAGAGIREAFVVDELVSEDGQVVGIKGRSKNGKTVTERAKLVIGADGRHSRVAELVHAEQYNEKPRFHAARFWQLASGSTLTGGVVG